VGGPAANAAITYSLLGGSAVGIKVLVDAMLFFVSYKIQHKYIFKDDRKKEAPETGKMMKRDTEHTEQIVDAVPRQEG
jgi:hypothetical protein